MTMREVLFLPMNMWRPYQNYLALLLSTIPLIFIDMLEVK